MKERTISFALVVLFSMLPGLAAESRTVSAADFMNVADAIPGIIVDLRYAGTDNIFRQRFYTTNLCYLRRSTMDKLRAAQKEFVQSGLRLKILDGYRPLSVQEQLWKAKPDARYVAPPARGSRHNRGAAVDVTLVDSEGHELAMPTAFDEFTEKAGAHYAQLPAEVLKNRDKLQEIMTRHGFAILDSEWWHFDDADWRSFPIANVSPEEMATQKQRQKTAREDEVIEGRVGVKTPSPAATSPPPGKKVSDPQKRHEVTEGGGRIPEPAEAKRAPP